MSHNGQQMRDVAGTFVMCTPSKASTLISARRFPSILFHGVLQSVKRLLYPTYLSCFIFAMVYLEQYLMNDNEQEHWLLMYNKYNLFLMTIKNKFLLRLRIWATFFQFLYQFCFPTRYFICQTKCFNDFKLFCAGDPHKQAISQ